MSDRQKKQQEKDQKRAQRDEEAKKKDAEKLESMKTKVDEKEIAKTISSLEKEFCEEAESSQDGEDRAKPARGVFTSLYDRLNRVLASVAETAKLPFVRESLPEIRRLVSKYATGTMKASLLFLLDHYEVVIPETEDQADLMVERLPVKGA